jgi:ribonuclease VapC
VTLFMDASVIVAIIQREPGHEALIGRLEDDGGPFIVSPVARMESALSLARRMAEARGANTSATPEMVATARALVDQFIADIEAREMAVDAEAGALALDAAQTYGKIVSHPAALNMGDCLAYGCAKAAGVRIAYKGEDFGHTDIGW